MSDYDTPEKVATRDAEQAARAHYPVGKAVDMMPTSEVTDVRCNCGAQWPCPTYDRQAAGRVVEAVDADNSYMEQSLTMLGVAMSAQFRENPTLHIPPGDFSDLMPRTTSTQATLAMAFMENCPRSPENGHPYLIGQGDLERLRDLFYFAEKRGMIPPMLMVADDPSRQFEELRSAGYTVLDLQTASADEINAELDKHDRKLSVVSHCTCPPDGIDPECHDVDQEPSEQEMAYGRGYQDGVRQEKANQVGNITMPGEGSEVMVEGQRMRVHLEPVNLPKETSLAEIREDMKKAVAEDFAEALLPQGPKPTLASLVRRASAEELNAVLKERGWKVAFNLGFEPGVTEYDEMTRQLIEAIRLTVEYVGLEMLPPIDGWSWYEALKKYAPEVAKNLRESKSKEMANKLGIITIGGQRYRVKSTEWVNGVTETDVEMIVE